MEGVKGITQKKAQNVSVNISCYKKQVLFSLLRFTKNLQKLGPIKS